MTGIRMLALDLDRTLLKSDKSLSPYTLSVLAACREKGTRLAIATARPPRSVAAMASAIAYDAAIYANGALVRANGETIRRFGVPPEDARRILAGLVKAYPGANISCELNDALYANFDVSALWNSASAIRSDFTDLPPIPCEKILIDLNGLPNEDAIRDMLTPELYLLRDFDGLGQILNRNASKLNGLYALCERYSIRINEIAAFGDDQNDIEMLRECGVGVAVQNAIDEAKAAADHICPSNDEDGPARWIAENIL